MASDSSSIDREVLGLVEAAGRPLPTARLLTCSEMVDPRQVGLRVKQLVASGFLVGVPGRGMDLTPKGRSFLLRLLLEERVATLELAVSTLQEQVELIPSAAEPGVTAAEISAAMMDLDPVDRELYDRLRMIRNAVAAALAISSYQLGQNRSLRMLADMQSRQPEQPLGAEQIIGVVPGMTPKTWDRVGQSYLAVLDRWCAQQRVVRSRGSGVQPYEVPP